LDSLDTSVGQKEALGEQLVHYLFADPATPSSIVGVHINVEVVGDGNRGSQCGEAQGQTERSCKFSHYIDRAAGEII
jgi:hypothetical protein